MAITEEELVLGAGTALAKWTPRNGHAPELALDGGEDRILALLSVSHGRSVSPAVLGNIRRAATAWGRGETCLASIELALSRLPGLEEGGAYRLFLTDRLLGAGVAPTDLMQALGFAPTAPEALKAGYNPDEPRIPAGNGRESGEWTDGGEPAAVPVAGRPRLGMGEYRRGDINAFFDTLYPQVHALVQRLGIDETWLLGLAAYESFWLGPHDRRLNNPFGVTHGGGRNVGYDSIAAAVGYWEKKYGPIVRGATGPEDFAQRLWEKGYNTENKEWRSRLVGVIRSAPRRLNQWKSRRGKR